MENDLLCEVCDDVLDPDEEFWSEDGSLICFACYEELQDAAEEDAP